MTQNQLIIEYILENGSIVPAKVGGSPYKDGFFGSETSKRCREMRKAGKLYGVREGRFERFFLIEQDSVVEEKGAVYNWDGKDLYKNGEPITNQDSLNL